MDLRPASLGAYPVVEVRIAGFGRDKMRGRIGKEIYLLDSRTGLPLVEPDQTQAKHWLLSQPTISHRLVGYYFNQLKLTI